MKALYKKAIEASQLPAEWREEGRFAPDERVTVYIEPADPELVAAASLEALMDVISRRAMGRGLTEERLQELLDEP